MQQLTHQLTQQLSHQLTQQLSASWQAKADNSCKLKTVEDELTTAATSADTTADTTADSTADTIADNNNIKQLSASWQKADNSCNKPKLTDFNL